MLTQLQLTGIGLRAPHFSAFLDQKPKVAWIEVHSENYLGEGGKPLRHLLHIREDYPVSLHGVNLSIGSADDLNWQYLQKLKQLIERVEPCLVSDHLAFTSINGQYFHDLLPLPYTKEALNHIVSRVNEVQNYLQRQILIENISSYIQYESSEYTEWGFLKEVVTQSGCGLLLDVNNIYVNAMNFNFSPETYLQNIPNKLVQEIHLGGFSTLQIADKEILVDTHSKPIMPAVWDLYKRAIQQFGAVPTIIEWDQDLPSLETLELEAYRAEKIIREVYASTKRSA